MSYTTKINGQEWFFIFDHVNPDQLGYIPVFFSGNDPRPLKEQLNSSYAHGGGWMPFEGFKRVGDASFDIQYLDDPIYKAVAYTHFRDQVLVFYPHSWVAIWNDDGTFEISRMD